MAGLDEPNRSPDNGEQALGTVDDSILLAWAEENGLSPQDALMEALRRGIIPSRYSKNLTALTLEEQRRALRRHGPGLRLRRPGGYHRAAAGACRSGAATPG